MHNGKGERKKSEKTGVNYEEAISEAFSEIFQNLKEIEKDTTELQRKMLYLRRRRSSAPADMIRQTTTASSQPKVHMGRRKGVRDPATLLRETTTAFGQMEVDLERRGSSLSSIPSFNESEVRGRLLTPPNKKVVDDVSTVP